MTLNLVDNSLERLPSGLRVGNLLGRLLVKREFDNDQVYVIPVDIDNSPKQSDTLYLQSLFSLRHQDISIAICDRYDNMLELLRYIEKNWTWLADEIEKGNRYFRPDAERANAIRNVMKDHHIGTQLIPQLWSRLNCILIYDIDRLGTLDQLEIGRRYEMVVTTLSGLYRYINKITLLVVGRYHDTPTVIVT